MKAQTLVRIVSTASVAYAMAITLVIASLVGCTTLGPDGTRTYDPVKSSQVVTALTVPVRDTVARVILNSPQHSDQLANYFRSVGVVFCKMQETGNFNPSWVLSEVDRATGSLQQGLDPLAITAKNTAVALYAIFYEQRHSADLDPQKWPAHVAKLMCQAIDGGLRDAGKLGVEIGN